MALLSVVKRHFPFDANKATEIAALFMRKDGDSINVMKLIKLAYLLDRLSIRERGVPVMGGWYLSMKHGPVTGDLLDLANSDFGAEDCPEWTKHISDRANHEIGLLADPGTDHLAETEIKLAETIWGDFGHLDQWALRDWCHRHCPEWTVIDSGRREITIGSLCQSLGLPASEAEEISRSASELAYIDSVINA